MTIPIMMIAMTGMLISAAEMSNIISIIAIVIFIFGMIVFVMKNMTIFWLHGDDYMMGGTSVHTVPQHIPQMKMMKVHIPFTLKLLETSSSSYQEVRCSVSSQVRYRLLAYWGVSIRELHLFLWRPWAIIYSAIEEGSLLAGQIQQQGMIIRGDVHGDKVLLMSLPNEPLDLGTPPRLCYPLVIFLVRDTSDTIHPDETVALINVVHIKDSVCTLPTSILAQYLKQANGQLSCLKQLYLATGNPMTYETNLEIADNVEQLCVVCHIYPLSRALLPCRHTCICAFCFSKLESCPLCRSQIHSYFCIRGEDYLHDIDKSSSPTIKPEPIAQWFQDRLTDFLGFRR